MPLSSLTITHCPLWPYLFLLLSNSHFPSSRVAVINQNSRVWLRSPNPAQSFLRSFKLQKQSPISQKGHFCLLLGWGPVQAYSTPRRIAEGLCLASQRGIFWPNVTCHVSYFVLSFHFKLWLWGSKQFQDVKKAARSLTFGFMIH